MYNMNIGVDLGGMSIKAGLVDDNGKILYKEVIPTGADRPMPDIVSDIALLVNTILKRSGCDEKEVKSVGIGVPGATCQEKGEILYCFNVNLTNAPIAKEIHKYVNLPVYLNNDANAAAIAEYDALGREMECFVAVTLGTGVGGGIIINNRLFSGSNGVAGEFGHMVIKEGGKSLGGGLPGCFEAYASVTALISQTKSAMEEDKNSIMHKISIDGVTGKTAFDAAKAGDKTAIHVVDNYISYVSTGIVNIINIFQPEVLVIGGAISKEGDYLLDPIKEFCAKNAYGADFAKHTQIKAAILGNDAGIIGAAMLHKYNEVI